MSGSMYEYEHKVMSNAIKNAYSTIFSYNNMLVQDKDKFDVVTVNDYKIEEFLIKTISEHFPNDQILSEETNFDTQVKGRTWTIDPIDGTYNMSRNSPMFGIQCALYENEHIVFSIIFLPEFDELYYAEKGCGSFLNGQKISVAKNDLSHSVISFGDFPHKYLDDFADEHRIMTKLSERVAKIRMFGAACIDFAYLASGRTDGTVMFTKNKWDIAPGILVAKEAGAFIGSLSGEYTPNSRAVIAASTVELYNGIIECYEK